jgi:hypothetical protein
MHSSGGRALLDVQVIVRALVLAVFFILTACDRFESAPPSLNGNFSGTAADGRRIVVTLEQTGQAVAGRGVEGDRSFAVSAVVAWQGPALLTFQDGSVAAGSISLRTDGSGVSIRGLREPLNLERGGEPAAAAGGAFAGRFFGAGPPEATVSLTQSGELIAGTGVLDGRAVAVVGRVIGPNAAEGRLLFNDESHMQVRAALADEGRELRLEGIGGNLVLARR